MHATGASRSIESLGIGLVSTSSNNKNSSSLTPLALQNSSTSSSIPISAAGNQSTSSNITNVDSCWSAWQTYWSLSASSASEPFGGTWLQSPVYVNQTTIWTVTSTGRPGYTLTVTYVQSGYTDTYTVTSFFEGDPVTTITDTEIVPLSTETFTEPNPSTPDSTFTYTATVTSTVFSGVWSGITVPPVTAPPCSLPMSFSACQQQWNSWVSAETMLVPPPPAEEGYAPNIFSCECKADNCQLLSTSDLLLESNVSTTIDNASLLRSMVGLL
jgi:hypothetical protein